MSFMHACEADQVDPGFIRTTAAVNTTYVVDLETMELAYSLPYAKGRHHPISPDGSLMVRQAGEGALLAGPLIVGDLETGEAIVELEGVCWWGAIEQHAGESACAESADPPFSLLAQRVRWSPDGTMIAAVNGTLGGTGAYVAVWDSNTGELVFFEPGNTDLGHHVDAIFTPDSSGLVTSYWGGALRTFSTDTWNLDVEVPFELSWAGLVA